MSAEDTNSGRKRAARLPGASSPQAAEFSSPKSSPFGPQPGERVFTGGRAMPPSLRVRSSRPVPPAGPRRPANVVEPAGLEFEPETAPPSEALAELMTAPASAKSSLAFEPDEGDILDRVHDSRLPSDRPPPRRPDNAARPTGPREVEPETEGEGGEIASLIEIAAAGSTPLPRRGRTFTPAPRRADLSGDLEAELFGPRRARQRKKPASGVETGTGSGGPGREKEAGTPSGPEGEAEAEAAPPEPEGRGRKGPPGWMSILVSGAVVGRKRRKRTTARLLRRTRFAEKAIEQRALQVAGAARRLDAVLRRVRLSLAGLFATAAIVAVAALTGVPIVWAAGILAICLVLTVAGQPARNLLGYAGVIITAAAIAEIVRQRERFIEIFKMFLS